MPPSNLSRRPHKGEDADAAAVAACLELAAQAESLAVYYTALLYNYHYGDAPPFRDLVLAPLRDERYAAAFAGLVEFISQHYDRQPLLREFHSGIREVLYPVLQLLANIAEYGVDPP